MLSPQIKNLIDDLKKPSSGLSPKTADQSTIGINEITKKAGVFYEKVRYSVEYKEEHTIRRSAIERILNRNLIFSKDGQVARLLIEELIRGGYVENNAISELDIPKVQAIIDKYLFLEKHLAQKGESTSLAKKRITSFTASELELLFFDNKEEMAVLKAYYETAKKAIKFQNESIPEKYKNAQIFIACMKSLLGTDEESLAYALWLVTFPEWRNHQDNLLVEQAANRFTEVQFEIEKQLKNSLSQILLPKMKNLSIYFAVIKQLIQRFGGESERIFENQSSLDEEAERLLQSRYEKENEKTRKRAFRAIIYILSTKTLLGLALELPYDLYLMGQINRMAFAVNIFFHPILLFVMTSTIKKLGPENTKHVLSGIHSVVYDEPLKVIHIKKKKDTNFLYSIFILLYAVIFLAIFGALVITLQKFGFNALSILLFMFFLTLVSYFGLRIRYNAKNWAVSLADERTSIFFWNLMTLPILEAGRWFSTKFQAINIMVFIMDFIIETPFKMILKVSDSFVSFMKEKKEQIY